MRKGKQHARQRRAAKVRKRSNKLKKSLHKPLRTPMQAAHPQPVVENRAPSRSRPRRRNVQIVGGPVSDASLRTDNPDPRPRTEGPLGVTCPSCGALPDTKCMTRAGNPAKQFHKPRVTAAG